MTGRKKKSKTEDIIPEEINDHLKLFGKEPWEVDYNKFGRCEMCGSRIDEFGYCACSAGSIGQITVKDGYMTEFYYLWAS